LEHIPDYRSGLRESHRVLRTGGTLLFTCPFFAVREDNLIRARVLPDGAIQHLEKPEIHGNVLDAAGILTFYHFGWVLLEDIHSAGFATVEVGVLHDPLAGLTGNNFPQDDPYGCMLPLLFRCHR